MKRALKMLMQYKILKYFFVFFIRKKNNAGKIHQFNGTKTFDFNITKQIKSIFKVKAL